MTSPRTQARPLTVDDVVAAVRAADLQGASLVLAVSALTFGERAELRRIGVFALRDGAVTPLVDTHVRNDQGEALYTALAQVATVEVGGWDAHFADGWTWVWSRSRERFALWHRTGGAVAIADGSGLHLGDREVPWLELDQVEVWASRDLVHRQVRLPCVDDEPVVLVAVEDGVALVDPAYDRVMLDAETTWMVELAQALAAALNKPFFDQRGGTTTAWT